MDLHMSIRRGGAAPESGWVQEYVVPVEEDDRLSVLDALDYVFWNIDSTLAYPSHAECRQGACGQCVVRVNGKRRLACREPAVDGMLVEPADMPRVVRDLYCRGRAQESGKAE